jgi:hypothetical protein
VQETGGEADSTMTSPHHSMASRDTVTSYDTPLSVTRCELSSVESPEPSTQEQVFDFELEIIGLLFAQLHIGILLIYYFPKKYNNIVSCRRNVTRRRRMLIAVVVP